MTDDDKEARRQARVEARRQERAEAKRRETPGGACKKAEGEGAQEEEEAVDMDADEWDTDPVVFPNGESDPIDIESAHANFPEWSWDRVRTWVKIRRNDDYDDDQIEAIAAHDLVMLEKANGFDAHGSVEAGTLHAARRIKEVNPKTKILFYLNALINYGNYAAKETFDENWAVRKAGTDEAWMFKGKYYFYDHTNLAFREWWIGRALEMLADDAVDGVFIDAICKTVCRGFCTEEQEAAYLDTANELRSRLPEGKILVGNALRAAMGGNTRHLSYLDGSYLENWDNAPARTGRTGPQTTARSLQLMSAALKVGRMITMSTGPFNGPKVGNEEEEEEDLQDMSVEERYEFMKTKISFPLAVFLMVVEPYAYFSYQYGVDASPKPRGRAAFDDNRYEEVTRKLGKPTGPYEREGDFVFRREFEYLKVMVNVETKECTLDVVQGNEEL